jgi:hypothetical protein
MKIGLSYLHHQVWHGFFVAPKYYTSLMLVVLLSLWDILKNAGFNYVARPLLDLSLQKHPCFAAYSSLQLFKGIPLTDNIESIIIALQIQGI